MLVALVELAIVALSIPVIFSGYPAAAQVVFFPSCQHSRRLQTEPILTLP